MNISAKPSDTRQIPPLSDAITLVSGLPRSGTSMMMRMLSAGGMPILTDNIRKANEDNPNGYFELEKIKQLDQDTSWLKKETGKTVKAISALLPSLPKDVFYYVIFMQRHMPEILASQKKMLERRGIQDDATPDDVMAAKYENYLSATFKWLEKQPNFHVLVIQYNEVLQNPRAHAEKINNFLGNMLDIEKMIRVVDKNLYRQRKES